MWQSVIMTWIVSVALAGKKHFWGYNFWIGIHLTRAKISPATHKEINVLCCSHTAFCLGDGLAVAIYVSAQTISTRNYLELLCAVRMCMLKPQKTPVYCKNLLYKIRTKDAADGLQDYNHKWCCSTNNTWKQPLILLSSLNFITQVTAGQGHVFFFPTP